MPGSSRPLAWSVVIALVLPAAVQADYRAYARGQEAAADENWAEVEREMQQALAANPTPKVRVRLYGQRFAPYVPHYYLGLAAYRQGDCTTAMRWFEDAAAAPVIAQLAEFQGVVDTARRECAARLVTTKPASGTIGSAQTATTTSTTLAPDPTRPVAQTSTTTSAPTPAAVKPDPVPSTAPAALRTALRQWLSGRYREVSAANVAGVQGKALAHLHLLRAAALFAQSEIDPTDAEALRARAEQEIRNARRAAPTIVPDADFFSPRFRGFFQSIR